MCARVKISYFIRGAYLDINYELYKVSYVATTSGFSEASKLLFIPQSAVSQSTKVLEKKLGITLFIRSTKARAVNVGGRNVLLRHVEPAINLIARGEAQIMEAGTLGGGQLRIGAATQSALFLFRTWNRFTAPFLNVSSGDKPD